MSLGYNELIVLFLLLTVGLFIYLLPSFIAFRKKKESAWAIFAVNFLFGWTFLGWIGALIWSLTGDRQMQQNIYINQSVPQHGQLEQVATNTKLCPACAETIKKEATKCRYCGEILYKEVV